MRKPRALLTGHFSTVGDIESLVVVRDWLDELKIASDVAPFTESVRRAMPDTVHIGTVNPADYGYLVVICGPVWGEQLDDVGLNMDAFRHCRRIGINLTLVQPTQDWNPFDILLERDSDRATRPDLTLLRDTRLVPVLGRCLVKRQTSYAGRERHDVAIARFEELVRKRGYAVLDLDTRWYIEKNTLKSASQFFSALQRVDVLLTNRLHGMVYALKAGVPVVAIDAIEGGAKVMQQARRLGWPCCLAIEDATLDRLESAVDWCLSAETRAATERCRRDAQASLAAIKAEFMSGVLAG